MHLSFTQKKNIRKNFGKLKESLSIPNLIEVQKESYHKLTNINIEENALIRGLERVFKGIFPIDDLNDKELSIQYFNNLSLFFAKTM